MELHYGANCQNTGKRNPFVSNLQMDPMHWRRRMDIP